MGARTEGDDPTTSGGLGGPQAMTQERGGLQRIADVVEVTAMGGLPYRQANA